jgi:hypothetical protein
MSRSGVVCAVAFLLAQATGCSDGAVGGGGYDPTVPPTGAPLATMTTTGGAWDVAIWLYPASPRKGTNDVVYRVRDLAGAPIDALTVQVQPWMPAHGHGTSTIPAVSAQGAGLYLATPIALYMSGRWELRTTIAGTVSEDVVFVVDIP